METKHRVVIGAALGMLVMLMALFVPLAFAEDEPLQVNMGTDNGGSIHGSGKVTIKAPTRYEIGQLMQYDGVGPDNFYRRTLQAAHCEGLDTNGRYQPPYSNYDIDVSGVRQYLEITATRVVGQTSEPIGLNSIRCENGSGSAPLSCSTSLTRSVTNTFSKATNWNVSATVSQAVNYRVGSSSSPAGIGGETRFTVSGGYGETSTTTNAETIGATNSAEVTAQPGEDLLVELVADRGIIDYEVTYSSDVEGPVVVTCVDGTKRNLSIAGIYGGHLPGFALQSQFDYTLVPRSTQNVVSTEHISITNYTNARVTSRDVLASKD